MLGFVTIDPQLFDKDYRLRPDLWQGAALELCRSIGLPCDRFEASSAGSNLIARVGSEVMLKIFPPFHRHQYESESRVMQHLDGRLQLPIPRFLGAGEAGNGWTYLVMSRLSGTTLDHSWPAMSLAEKKLVLRDIGTIMAKVHTVPVLGLESLPPEWNSFIQAQIQGCRQRHQRFGMPAWFVDQVDAFVQESLSLLPQVFSPVILTGEYTPFNLLVENEGPIQKIAGMIDFGDAMIGMAAYDLLGPALFLGEGNPELLRSLFEGYGIQQTSIELQRRLMLLQILHRYSDFDAQLCIPNWQSRVASIAELQQLIFPMDF